MTTGFDRSTDELLLRRLHDALDELREIHTDLLAKFGLFPEFAAPSERLGQVTLDLSDLWLGRNRLSSKEG